jgi:type IX secretion system PorP/SprF family membrane protein
MINKLIILVFCFLAVCTAHGQETAPNYLMYRYNMNILNPAYAGVNAATEVGFGFRKQSLDFSGASETQYASISMPYKNNIGLGASLINDTQFIRRETSVTLDVSYKLKIDEQTRLYFGMKFGSGVHAIDYSALGVNDPLFSGSQSTFSPKVGLGTYLKGNHYFFSLSIPNVVLSEIQVPKIDSNGSVISQRVQEIFQMYASTGYSFRLSDKLKLNPSVFARFVSNQDLLMDISTVAGFSNKMELGITYRFDRSLIGSVMLKLHKNTSLGYAYESITSEFSAVVSGTHEFVLRFFW